MREQGNWEDWIEFFLEGVKTTSEQAAESAVKILNLFENDRRRLETLGRAQPSAALVYALLQKKPVVNARTVQEEVALSRPTILKMLNALEDLEILRRQDNRKRDQLFVYHDYVALLNEGVDVGDGE